MFTSWIRNRKYDIDFITNFAIRISIFFAELEKNYQTSKPIDTQTYRLRSQPRPLTRRRSVWSKGAENTFSFSWAAERFNGKSLDRGTLDRSKRAHGEWLKPGCANTRQEERYETREKHNIARESNWHKSISIAYKCLVSNEINGSSDFSILI